MEQAGQGDTVWLFWLGLSGLVQVFCLLLAECHRDKPLKYPEVLSVHLKK